MTSDKTILIIDDDRNLRETLALIFRRAGYCVLSAIDVERAFLPLRNHPCDLVILDFNNLGSFQTDTIAQIQSSHPALPIIVLTGGSPVEAPDSPAEKKMLGYLEKPVDPVRILNYVAELIQQS